MSAADHETARAQWPEWLSKAWLEAVHPQAETVRRFVPDWDPADLQEDLREDLIPFVDLIAGQFDALVGLLRQTERERDGWKLLCGDASQSQVEAEAALRQTEQERESLEGASAPGVEAVCLVMHSVTGNAFDSFDYTPEALEAKAAELRGTFTVDPSPFLVSSTTGISDALQDPSSSVLIARVQELERALRDVVDAADFTPGEDGCECEECIAFAAAREALGGVPDGREPDSRAGVTHP